ncbi:hypothetical protein SLEP1_g47991 [Rubroshorea leprosula]|uniref:Uncharacterized protein n=1 Tax=Rubroshorea leprosula TaxID=152421 RepID=A0AAV5LV64_9ROSI|nr:hypothetical protein SLEP1_g47991 [Rubroshorea leprosula]
MEPKSGRANRSKKPKIGNADCCKRYWRKDRSLRFSCRCHLYGLNGYIAAEEDDGGGAEKRCLLLDIGSKGRRRGRIYWKELG